MVLRGSLNWSPIMPRVSPTGDFRFFFFSVWKKGGISVPCYLARICTDRNWFRNRVQPADSLWVHIENAHWLILKYSKILHLSFSSAFIFIFYCEESFENLLVSKFYNDQAPDRLAPLGIMEAPNKGPLKPFKHQGNKKQMKNNNKCRIMYA